MILSEFTKNLLSSNSKFKKIIEYNKKNLCPLCGSKLSTKNSTLFINQPKPYLLVNKQSCKDGCHFINYCLGSNIEKRIEINTDQLNIEIILGEYILVVKKDYSINETIIPYFPIENLNKKQIIQKIQKYLMFA